MFNVYCHGTSYHGVLGDEGQSLAYNLIDIEEDIESISNGYFFTCALATTGKIWCWGFYDMGQLGNGTGYGEDGEGMPFVMTGFGQEKPSQVLSIGPATSVSAGRAHACALLAAGEVYCWGANDFGQIGDGTRAKCYISTFKSRVDLKLYQCKGNRVLPTRVAGLPGPAIQISVGDDYSCALLADHTLWCWGSQEFGVVPAD